MHWSKCAHPSSLRLRRGWAGTVECTSPPILDVPFRRLGDAMALHRHRQSQITRSNARSERRGWQESLPARTLSVEPSLRGLAEAWWRLALIGPSVRRIWSNLPPKTVLRSIAFRTPDHSSGGRADETTPARSVSTERMRPRHETATDSRRFTARCGEAAAQVTQPRAASRLTAAEGTDQMTSM